MGTTVAHHTSTVQYDAALRTLAAAATKRYAGEQLRISKGLVIALNGGVTFPPEAPAGLALVTSQTDGEVVYNVNGHCDCKDATHGATEGRCKHRWAKTLTSRALALATPAVETIPTVPEPLDGPQAARPAPSVLDPYTGPTRPQTVGVRWPDGMAGACDPAAAPVATIATLSEQLYGPQAAATAAQRTATQRPPAAEVPGSGSLVSGSNQKPETRNQKPGSRVCPEAAFSLTLKGLLDGQEAMLTVRGQTAAEFTANLAVVRGLFDRPTPPPPSPPASPPAATPPAEAPTRACPVHAGVLMTERHNARGAWWSHPTADGGYCKGK